MLTYAEYMKAARELQALARHFGDRCNSDSTLTAREATQLVRVALNGGNVLEAHARGMGPPPGETDGKETAATA